MVAADRIDQLQDRATGAVGLVHGQGFHLEPLPGLLKETHFAPTPPIDRLLGISNNEEAPGSLRVGRDFIKERL